MKLIWLLMAALIGYSASASASTFKASRSLYINTVIGKGNLDAMGDKLIDWSIKSKEPVTLLLNSPGGAVYDGLRFISRMHAAQAKGVKIQCIVVDLAASMAFQILTQCDERYSLDTSLLLWHRARVFMFMGILTAPLSTALGKDLQRIDDVIYKQLSAAFVGVPNSYLSYHFEQETLHVGSQLAKDTPKFIQSYSDYEGLFEMIKEDKLDSSEKHMSFSIFDMIDEFNRSNSIVYIWEQYVTSALNKSPIIINK